jgi:D-alanyl-D-alanine carboxypeptidase
VIRDFPEHAHYWAKPEARVGKTLLTTHNGLLRTFEGADGIKTGFICDSGFNVVASATRDGKRLMAVVLGEQTGADRTLRAASLLEHGFQQLGWKQLFNPTTIDNMTMAADAKGIMSMRQSVVSWECGTGRRARSRTAARAGTRKTAKSTPAGAVTTVAAPAAAGAAPVQPAKPAAKPAKAAAAGAVPATGKPKPAAAPATAKPAAPARKAE